MSVVNRRCRLCGGGRMNGWSGGGGGNSSPGGAGWLLGASRDQTRPDQTRASKCDSRMSNRKDRSSLPALRRSLQQGQSFNTATNTTSRSRPPNEMMSVCKL